MSDDRRPGRSDPELGARDADRRFVDALLDHHFHGSRAASSERIASALRRIDDAPRTVVRAHAASWWFRALPQVAAALVIGALLLVPVFLSDTASAAIDRARVAMSRLVDQHYRIEIGTPVGVTLTGEMWFRGADLVALRLDSVAAQLWAGEGRDSAWVVPPLSSMPVRVNEKGTLLDALSVGDDLEAPFLRLSTMLERLRDGFEFEFGEDGRTIVARRVADAPAHLPEWVRVRLAVDGVVREFEGHWSPIFGPRNCRLTWLDDDPMPASFYEHAAHHHDRREVVDLR